MLAVVLVAPQMGENIGAVARAMGNFGLNDLRIVSPRDGWPNEAAIAMAAHAKPIIEQAKIFDNLADAVADCTYVAAATARNRELKKPHHHSKNWMEFAPQNKAALLFGRENNGLSNEEISYAHAIVSVPVDAACPSINLSQSAAILCYEWFQYHHTKSITTSLETCAPMQELEHFFDKLEFNLDKTNFWQVAEKKPKMLQNIRTLLMRAQPNSQEVRTLHGIVKALSRRDKN